MTHLVAPAAAAAALALPSPSSGVATPTVSSAAKLLGQRIVALKRRLG